MPYSHLAAPALGFDLARLQGGERVAVALRTALVAGPAELDRLAAAHPGAGPREARVATWRDLVLTEGMGLSEVLPLAGAALDGAAQGDTTLLRRLEQSLVGDASALDRLIRRELLDWTWVEHGATAVQDPAATPAADVLADAAISAYLEGVLPADVRRQMAAPLLRAGVDLASAPDDTGVPGADGRLRRLAGADVHLREVWRLTVDRLRPATTEWAPAMHQASWALVTSDRLRTATDVQLAGVIAFRRGGFTARDAAYGVWNAVSGALQASVVEDLLPADAEAVLTRSWHTVEEDAA